MNERRSLLRLPALMLLLLFLANGCAYLPGQTDNDAVARVRSAAEQGDPQSQYRLGLLYTNGTRLPQDHAKAVKWFGKAARNGHREAQYMLGIAYYAGRGVAGDPGRARHWLLQAADQGHARAQFQLGEIYLNGHGVPREPTWAARWYGKAAEQGHVKAQFALGVAFASGLGLPVNRVRACQWLTLAQRAGHGRAGQVAEKVCGQLSGGQRKRALGLADDWHPAADSPLWKDRPTNRYIQYRLMQLGFDPGPVDGIYGRQTGRAVKRYLSESDADDGLVTRQQLVERLRRQSVVSQHP